MNNNSHIMNPYRNGQSLTAQLHELEAGQHVWEGIIARVNHQVERLQDLGVFNSTIILGPLVMRREYGVDGPADSAEIVQAGLSSESGLVAIFWDIEDLHEANKAELHAKDWDAIDRARPLSECSTQIRWLVAKESHGLLELLMQSAKLAR